MSKITSSTTAESSVTVLYEHFGDVYVCFTITDMDSLKENVNFCHKRPSEYWFILVPCGLYKGEANEST